VLDPGRTVTVKVFGPDGKALEGVRVQGQFAREYWGHDALPAEFTVYGLDPGKGRLLQLQHLENNLAGRCEIKADERGPVAVTLQPAATVAGRVLDEDGRPLAHADINVYTRAARDGVLSLHSREDRTDADGQFRIAGLLPGLLYTADVLPPEQPHRRKLFEDLSLKSGEVKDFGELKPGKGGE
jgi:hypothetical protein